MHRSLFALVLVLSCASRPVTGGSKFLVTWTLEGVAAAGGRHEVHLGDAVTFICPNINTNFSNIIYQEDRLQYDECDSTVTNGTSKPFGVCGGSAINYTSYIIQNADVLQGSILYEEGEEYYFVSYSDGTRGTITSDITSGGQCEDGFKFVVAVLARVNPPVINTEPSDQLLVVPGMVATFTVVASGDRLVFAWERVGGSLPSGASGEDTATLIISNVVEGDNGMYQCVVSNDAGMVTSRAAELTVLRPPVVTGSVSSLVNVGQSAMLTCSVADDPKPTFSWTGPVDLTGLVNETSSAPYTSTVTVPSAGLEYRGEYCCNATNDAGSTVECVTLSVVAIQPPMMLRAGPNGPTSYVFSWISPSVADNLTGYTINCVPSLEGIAISTITAESDRNTATVSNLENGVTYSCTVRATNSAGSSPPSNTVRVTTDESVPSGAPQNFAAIGGSHSITFSWDPPLPADRNGDITRYTITCSIGSKSHTADFTEAGSGTINGLTPFTSYNCSITASNSAGTGPSDVISVSTQEVVPGSVPVVLWRAQSDNVVEITWVEPYSANGIILGYSVTLKMHVREGFVYDENVTANTLTVEISDPSLVAGVPYTVTVVARTSVGYGETAQITDFTRQLAPPAPTGITAERLSDSHMLVSWDPLPLEVARGHVQNYTVHYQPTMGATGQSMTAMVHSTESSVLISGLDPSAMYSVTVSASTGGGVGIDSTSTDVQLAETTPSIAAVVGAVMAGVLMTVIGLSAAIIIWLLLKLRHHTSFSPQKDQRAEVILLGEPHSHGQQQTGDYVDETAISQEPPVSGGGGGGGGGQEPEYEVGVATESPQRLQMAQERAMIAPPAGRREEEVRYYYY